MHAFDRQTERQISTATTACLEHSEMRSKSLVKFALVAHGELVQDLVRNTAQLFEKFCDAVNCHTWLRANKILFGPLCTTLAIWHGVVTDRTSARNSSGLYVIYWCCPENGDWPFRTLHYPEFF